MARSTRNNGKRWALSEEKVLQKLARGNTPTRVIGLKLGRTEHAIYNKAHELNISLRPNNQSPYNRRTR